MPKKDGPIWDKDRVTKLQRHTIEISDLWNWNPF